MRIQSIQVKDLSRSAREPVSKKKPRGIFVRLIRGIFSLALLFTVMSTVLAAIYAFVPVPLTPLMVIRVGENLVGGKPIRLERDWLPLEKMSSKLIPAMIAAEDMKFFEHDGFDWEAIQKALRHNEKGRRIRGGSTISQQVAKNVFLWPARSWLRKSLEVWFTVLIETFWSKNRIIEVYLNVVELGDGVYGVEAASQRFFKKSASQINSSEAALIAAVLPNPRRFKISQPSSYVRFRQNLIRRRMWVAAQTIPEPASEMFNAPPVSAKSDRSSTRKTNRD